MSQGRTQANITNYIRRLRADNTSLQQSLDTSELELYFCQEDLRQTQEELRQTQEELRQTRTQLAVTPQ